jgi:hypothetical protein
MSVSELPALDAPVLVMSLWRAYPNCPIDERERIKEVIRALPVGYLEPLISGEALRLACVAYKALS